MKKRSPLTRLVIDKIIKSLSIIAAIAGILILLIIIKDIFFKGINAIGFDFFTNNMRPPGVAGGGVKNAIYGTLMITLVSTLIGVPVGMMAGVYLSEYGRNTRFGKIIRFSLNIMMGIPSIIIGIFFFSIMIIPLGHGSGYVGAFALSVIMIPIITKTTEEMLKLTPDSLRESALALGIPKWKMIISILFRSSKSGLLTGILLAVARVSGETAPLIFTARYSQYWPDDLNRETANLTMTIYNYAGQPFDSMVETAWGAALLVMGAVLLLTIISRFIVSHGN
ncbi:MAG: phosphate ABC transporter permease PstA [Myxococcota bacterium]